MKLPVALIGSMFLGIASTGCSSESADEPDGGDPQAYTIVANTVNNYSFSSTLTFPTVTVKPDSELTFDWSAVTSDFIDHPVDPMADIQTINMMLWKLPHADLEAKLNDDDLRQRDLAVVATYYTNGATTTARAFEFTSVGTPLTACDILPFLQLPNPDPNAHPECQDWAEKVGSGFDPAANTYTAMIATGDEPGEGTRMIQAFKLDGASTNTQVVLTPDSTQLEYDVDLDALQKTQVPAGNPALTIDWTNMTVNALGNPFLVNDITQALVARYEQPVSELEAQFLDLNILPAQRYRATIDAGTTADLSTFTNESGQAFPGIDGGGTWVLALICGGCRNPAPWYLTILEPSSQ